MSSQFEGSATYVFVASDDQGALADTNGEAALPTGATALFIDGYGAEVDTLWSTAGTGADLWIAHRNANGTLLRSPRFRGTTIANAVHRTEAALVEQVSYWGYNAVSGSMDSALGYYGLSVVLEHTHGLLNNSPLVKTIPWKQTTATQSALALGLAGVADDVFSREVHRDVIVDALCNESVTAANCLDNNLAVIYGASTIVGTATFPYNTGAGNMAVGDYIRLGQTAGAPAATALDDAVYQITAIDATTTIATLDRPARVPTGTYTAAGNMAEVLTAAEGAAANWGLKFTGHTPAQTSATFNPMTDTPFVVSFKITSDDFSTASVTYTTNPFIGVGTYPLVAFDEAYAIFHFRNRHVQAYPAYPPDIIDAVSGSTYICVSFDAVDAKYTSATTGINPQSKFTIKLYYLNDGGDVEADATAMDTILGSVNVTFA